ncbi:class I SAM-dependent DNA methyltransferase [Marinigracilibium pacificum]|uniref:Class I SAM-dependent methyltransferase n=1 Tax=Marinigracilibium pacificum TaxID=2729599 RepID=A0A848IZI2_9BACT|nr:class I SAM-dependent methyltransferase [Marinigracilibium pacificum]NMM48558.1 class I SAM-dependent methyltransferase [Marinigracilibium pacificum]
MDRSSQAVSIFNKKADQYFEKFMDQNEYLEEIKKFLETLPSKNPKVLDVACGPGNLSKLILDQNPRIELIGIDLSENMISLAKKNNPDSIFKIMDIRNLNKIKEVFDGIVCGFGIPYLDRNETELFINNCYKKLKANGILYLSYIEGDPKNSGYFKGSDGSDDDMFINYHEFNFISKLLKENNFKLIKTSTQIIDENNKNTIIISQKF